MTVIDAGTSLGDLVTTRPATARVFERLGLDYCCHGDRSVLAACAEAGLDADEVLQELDALAPEPPADWATMDPAHLVDHLEQTHHAFLHRELPRLGALLDKVAAVHGLRHPELAGVVAAFGALRDDLEPHLAKEERVLFPMVRALAGDTTRRVTHTDSVRGPIAVMLAEHDRAGELLALLRERTGGYTAPDDGCASYRALYRGLAELEADTHLHVHKENHRLFPAVIALEARPA